MKEERKYDRSFDRAREVKQNRRYSSADLVVVTNVYTQCIEASLSLLLSPTYCIDICRYIRMHIYSRTYV